MMAVAGSLDVCNYVDRDSHSMFVAMLVVDMCYIDSGYLLVCWQWQDHWMFVMLTETESLDVCCYVDSRYLLY